MAKTIDRRTFLRFAIVTVAGLVLSKPTKLLVTEGAEGVNLTIEDSGKLCADSASARIEFDGTHNLLSAIHSDVHLPGDVIVGRTPPEWSDNFGRYG